MKKNLLRWKALGMTLVLVLGLSVTQVVQAQDSAITGKVIDAETSEPVIGALVKVVGTTTAVATNVDGTFSVKAPATGSLEISYLGYKNTVIAVSGRTDVGTISLETDAQMLDQVIITGYGGTTSRAKSTASIATVPKKVFESGAYANPSSALAGAVPGLQVTSANGRPGANAEITLRGGTNLNGTGSPLIMIDGQIRGSFSDINPEDIADMQVLKDAAATAIYGARANNGVILITTKRGQAGRTSVTASAKVGLDYMNNPFKMVNAEEYLKWVRNGVVISAEYLGQDWSDKLSQSNGFGTGNNWQANGLKDAAGVWSTAYLTNENKHLLDKGWKTMKDPVTGQDLIYSEFDVASVGFNNPAITQDYNVSLSGGNEKGSYFASIGYYSQEGAPVDNYYNRLNFLFNGDYKITSWLKSESSFQWTNAKWRDWVSSNDGNYFTRMFSIPPTMRQYNLDGELLLGPNVGDGNPTYNQDKNIQNYGSDKFTFSEALTFQILPNLSFKATGIMMYDESLTESFQKDFLSGPGNINKTRSTSANFDRFLRTTINGVVNYNTDFRGSKHNFGALVGFEYYDQSRIGFKASGKGAPTDDFMDLGLTSNKEGDRAIDSWHQQYRIMSFFGRLNYSYDSKYLLDFTFREDGYSTLLGDNRWGFFPGVSAAWVISRENWMDGSKDWLSFLKLRASYGVNGNVSGIGAYDLQGAYGSTTYNNQIGFSLTGLPAPGIRWERSNTFEVAVDAGFLDGKLNVQLGYYNRTTEDLIAEVDIPVSSGFTKLRTNNGVVNNQGIELVIGATPIRTKDWEWRIDANITWNKNKIVKLPYNGVENNRQGGTQIYDPQTGKVIWAGGNQEGYWNDQMFGYVAEGFYRDEAHVKEVAGNRVDRVTSSEVGSSDLPWSIVGPDVWNNRLTDAEKAKDKKGKYGKYIPITPGDVIWKDLDNNDTIDTRDRKVIGYKTPKFFGGLSTTLTWKNLSLYIRTDFALGHSQTDFFRTWILGGMQGAYNVTTDIYDTWTPENTNSKYPIYQNYDQGTKNNYRYSTLMTKDASYLALREVSLSYSFPEKLIKKASMQNLTLSVTGQNLGYLTAVETGTPEKGGPSAYVGYGNYPLPVTLLFSAKITF